LFKGAAAHLLYHDQRSHDGGVNASIGLDPAALRPTTGTTIAWIHGRSTRSGTGFPWATQSSVSRWCHTGRWSEPSTTVTMVNRSA
jgi:hypothetical protein